MEANFKSLLLKSTLLAGCLGIAVGLVAGQTSRSEERRVGKEC